MSAALAATGPVPPDGAARVVHPDAVLDYRPGLLERAAADRLLDAVRAEVDWRRHVVRIAGREHPSPRLSAWQGEPGAVYAYSGVAYEPAPWTPAVAEIRAAVEAAAGVGFDSVLANLYRDGRDAMGWHSDDERELGPEPVIASVSLGAERRFVLKHRRRRDLAPIEMMLAHGSLLVMSGPTQACWRHALPRTKRPIGARVNLTFRRVLERRTPRAGPGG